MQRKCRWLITNRMQLGEDAGRLEEKEKLPLGAEVRLKKKKHNKHRETTNSNLKKH